MSNEQTLVDWIQADPGRIRALKAASEINLSDWCIAAGFVRNLVWDMLHEHETNSSLSDIDLIYFDPHSASSEEDEQIEQVLRKNCDLPWSVKNQARMHIRNNDEPYTSTEDAMRFWTEIETAVGVKLDAHGRIEVVAPFGLNALFAGTVTVNPYRTKLDDFEQRLQSKCWLQRWPKLSVNYGNSETTFL